MPTGLAIYTAERLETLVEKLAAEMKANPLGPLEREVIVVQSRGMYRWLTLELAKRLGIAATIATPFPGTFARALAERIEGKTDAPPSERYDPTEPSAYERDSLAWRIFRLLASETKSVTGPAAAYIKDDPDGRLRFQLATKLADRFDQYQLYRPDLLLAFERGEQPFEATPFRETASWQAALWRALVAEAGPKHLARRFTDLIELLGRVDTPPRGLPSRVSVFGATALPPVFLDLLGRLARFTPVALYVVTPTPEYWIDLRSERDAAKQLDLFAARGITAPDAHVEIGNPLLTSLGRQAQELDGLLQKLDTDGSAREHLDSPLPSRATVLGTLQADITELVHRGTGDGREAPLPLLANDRSLLIHICHSPMREMQVLRDVILDAFATDATLRPDQVFVLAPDISKYAPFVEAVFGVAHVGEPTLRFTIADRTTRAEEPLVDAALKLLDLVGSHVVASEVLALLDAAAVRRAARIEASEVETVRNWVTSVPIRWGMDGQHRRDVLALPSAHIDTADAADTWRGGLDRLLLGYAVGDDSELVIGKLPSSLAAGDADLLGRFVRFIDRLFGAIERLAHPRKLEEWARDLRASFTAIVKPDDDAEESAFRALLEATDRLGQHQRLAACNEPVSIEVVRDAIRSELEAAGGGAGFISGAITFCSLQPMRAIPAKLIAIVGLDDDAFPRRDRPSSFDLIAVGPRSGDRSAKGDDRNLFLETLLAARERLVLTYVGRSLKDNGELAPSSALVELASALDRTFAAPDRQPAFSHLTTVHALQPFNARYFSPSTHDLDEPPFLQSFSIANFEAALAQLEDTQFTPPFVSRAVGSKERTHEIELGDLTEFWVNPSKSFCTATLGIRFASEEPAVADTEPFSLESLPRYHVLNHILERRLAGHAAGEDELELLRSSGMLPHAELARVFYDALRDEVDELVETVASLFGGRPQVRPPVAIAVRQESWHLVGVLSTVTEHGQLRYRPATLRPKDRLRAWISHLALNAITPQSTFLVGKTAKDGKKEPYYFATRMNAVQNAASHLDSLVRGFVDGLERPLPVFENASYEYASRVHEAASGTNTSKTKDPFAAAYDKFRSGGFGGPGDDADPYVKLCIRGRAPLVEERERFEILSRELWTPLLDASEEIET